MPHAGGRPANCPVRGVPQQSKSMVSGRAWAQSRVLAAPTVDRALTEL